MLFRSVATAATLALLLGGCGAGADSEVPGEVADPIAVPELGACRVLTSEDIAAADNNSPMVDCSEEHKAETFAVGTFRGEFADVGDIEDPRLGAYIYATCSKKFQSFLGGDESMVMRSMLTWAWFRPSDDAWDEGARWYRCDVVGGTEHSEQLRTLPATAEGLFLGQPEDTWMMCANGDTVAGSEKVACSEPHDWRAVTTIKAGAANDPYPGDRMVEVRTRDYCSDSVGAWMNYPVDYEFGFTYFREAEWKAGNRRSVCWARTDK